MKSTTIRLIFALLLLACGSIQVMADGSIPRPPYCPPGSVCNP
jgi:hypothetical protein